MIDIIDLFPYLLLYFCIQATIRPDVWATYQAEKFWKQHRSNHLSWRYIGTPSGIMRSYPGVSLKKTYDHEKRPWYVSYDDQCMDSFTTTTFVVIRTDYRGSCKSNYHAKTIIKTRSTKCKRWSRLCKTDIGTWLEKRNIFIQCIIILFCKWYQFAFIPFHLLLFRRVSFNSHL